MANVPSSLRAQAQEADQRQLEDDEFNARAEAGAGYLQYKGILNNASVGEVARTGTLTSTQGADGKVQIDYISANGPSRVQVTAQEDLDLYNKFYNKSEAFYRQNRNELEAWRNYSTNPQLNDTRGGITYTSATPYTTGSLNEAKNLDPTGYQRFREYVNQVEDPTSQLNRSNAGLVAPRIFGTEPRSAYDKPYDQLTQKERDQVLQDIANDQSRGDISSANEALKTKVISAGADLGPLRAQAFIDQTNRNVRDAITGQRSNTTTQQDEVAEEGSSVTELRDENAAGQNVTSDYLNPTGATPRQNVTAGKNGAEAAPADKRNILDNYESYTYAFTLFMLSKEETNQLAENAGTFNPRNVIVASGGRYTREGEATNAGTEKNGAKRLPEWEDDFFLDNLKIVQLVAPSKEVRTTNSIDIEFTLIEPYGLSFLDRLLTTARRLKQKTYTHLCYLLQIDFYDARTGHLANLRKRLPMQISNMSIKVSQKGSEYNISALPFSHSAMLESYGNTPANFEITGSTLQTIFDDTSTDNISAGIADAEKNLRQRPQEEGTTITTTQGTYFQPPGVRTLSNQELANGLRAATYKVNSYVNAFNAFNKKLHELNIANEKVPPSTIKVRFHDDILKAQAITIPTADTTVGRNPTTNADTFTPGTNVNPDNTAKNWVISAGTSVAEVINQAMMNSEYIRSQVILAAKTEENKNARRDGVVNWWKIVPSVKIREYDDTTQRWSFDTTYFVLPYMVYNTRHRHLPIAKVTKNLCVKEFQYLYTGQNNSVIDFQLEFNMLYQTIAAAMYENNIDDPFRNPQGGPESEEQSAPPRDNRVGPSRYKEAIAFMPVRTQLVTSNQPELNNKGLERDPVATALSAIVDSIYTKSGGDMLTATIKILGDPQLIKQDDVYFNPAMFYDPNIRQLNVTDGIKMPTSFINTAGPDSALANNSLIMDAGHVLAWVEIRNPADIDLETGGVTKLYNKKDYAAFTGAFMIYECTSEFKNGMFTQSLELIRFHQQDFDLQQQQADSSQRNTTAVVAFGRTTDSLEIEQSADFNNSALVTFPTNTINTDETT